MQTNDGGLLVQLQPASQMMKHPMMPSCPDPSQEERVYRRIREG